MAHATVLVLLAWTLWVGWAQAVFGWGYVVAAALGQLLLDTLLLVWNAVVWKPSMCVTRNNTREHHPITTQ
jgi:hypothetical protein